MSDSRVIRVEQELSRVTVSDNSAHGVTLFRAPVILDSSGYYKRMPHAIDWQHIQEGDVLIALRMQEGTSGRPYIETLQLWHVLTHDGADSFEVEVNNIVGGKDGQSVYDSLALLAGAADSDG